MSIDSTPCHITNLTYTAITCITVAHSDGTYPVSINMLISSQRIQIDCIGDCMYSHSTDATPVVSSVSHTFINESLSLIHFIGKRFTDNEADIRAFVGDSECLIENSTEIEYYCKVSLTDLTVGTQHYTVNILNKGLAIIDVDPVFVFPTLYSTEPEFGSVLGGTALTITGTGFLLNDTSVVIGSTACNIVEITKTNIKCMTSPHLDGLEYINITSNRVQYPLGVLTFTEETPLSVNSAEYLGNDTFYIAGNLSESNVSVTINNAECLDLNTSSSYMICYAADYSLYRRVGEYSVHINLHPYGYVDNNITVSIELELYSVSENTGMTEHTCVCITQYMYSHAVMDLLVV